MNFIEAIKTGLPLRRKGKTTWYTRQSPELLGVTHTSINTLDDSYIGPEFFLNEILFTSEDITATDWEVKEKPIPITKTQFFDAVERAFTKALHKRGLRFEVSDLEQDLSDTGIGYLAEELGFTKKGGE